jgi:hypothetical protein
MSNFLKGQVIPQIDPREIGAAFHGAGAEIAEKGHFWMETEVFIYDNHRGKN